MFYRQFSAAAHRASSRYAAEQLEPVVDGMVLREPGSDGSLTIISLMFSSVCVVLFIKRFLPLLLLLGSEEEEGLVLL